MDEALFEEFLSRTLDDGQISRAESKTLKALLADAQTGPQKLIDLQARVFQKARKHARDPRDQGLITWLEDLVRALQSSNEPRPARQIDEAYFFPGDSGLTRLVDLIGSTRKTLDICVFTISHNRLADAIRGAHQRRIAVRILSDDEKSQDLGSDVIELAHQGIPVKYDNSPDHMHHKFTVFDGSLLLTGSFNWTVSAAEHNRENILITDEPRLVQKYQGEFEKLWMMF
jgi:mitochondrial cardiolipin hydrolase